MKIECDKNITVSFFFAMLRFRRKIAVDKPLFCRSIHRYVSLNVNTKLLCLRVY